MDWGERVLPKQTFNNIRNHLMLRVVLANRQRAGAIGNITVDAIRKAVPSRQEGETLWTFLVSEHKTAFESTKDVLVLKTRLGRQPALRHSS